ncbi:hypothetical protein ACG83_38495 [Frankia sp. R43]|uniref:LppP/LprE family lipoprotein n=1 Tax=Frankia sp. R43 TaxID=269536 RepID=UPI0006CA41EE|nr:LppP/LprE family lipoprotein [Frankia sp. R43]KPM50686.1 hypothetical protein ACG83_38495 [Frankia sp. R43]
MRRIVLIFVLTFTAVLTVTASASFAAPASAPASTPAVTSGTATPAAPAGALTPAQAVQLVRERGYTPMGSSSYEPAWALSAIVGRLTSSVDGHPQQAFFFSQGRFVGTDSVPSANVRWVWSTSDTVALQYDLYRPDDPMCCPSAGAATVRFRWNGTAVQALDPIPTNDWSAPTSRR